MLFLSFFLFCYSSNRVITREMPRKVSARELETEMGSSPSDGSGTGRLKWTDELHDLFEKAVNQLGGLDRATPKGILKAMGRPSLTIYHVKSHLQVLLAKHIIGCNSNYIEVPRRPLLQALHVPLKYRISKFVPESSTRGNFERRNISEILPNFSTTSGAQLNEALQFQKEAVRRLSDQLEVQRRLKLKIEAQGRFLDRIAEDMKNRFSILKQSKAFSPISLSSLSEGSESSYSKEFETGSELGDSEMRLEEEFRAPKRLKTGEDVLLQSYIISSVGSKSINQRMLLQKGAIVPLYFG